MAERVAAVTRLPDGTVEVRVAGDWSLHGGVPDVAAIASAADQPPPATRVAFDAAGLGAWDSSLLLFVERVRALCRQSQRSLDGSRLPAGIRRLLALADAQPAAPAPAPPPRLAWLPRLGERATAGARRVGGSVGLVGEMTLAFGRLLAGRARLRPIDVLTEMQLAGARALPIVSVVGFLLGVILAFVGGVTLRGFGATLYVADVVTIGVVRELGPILTAVVMAGRTGSAYAAQLGTMHVNDEIEALETLGLPPIEFLVLPRMLALCLMMPLLVLYADFVALVGGGVLSVSVIGLNGAQYLHESRGAIPLGTVGISLAKSIVFGVIVAYTGCARGLGAGKSAAAVGDAATAAVVAAIVWIILADGIFAVLLYVLGI